MRSFHRPHRILANPVDGGERDETTGSADRLFTSTERHSVDFTFDAAVAAVFPDMVRRSVPGYEIVVPLTGLIAAKHLRSGGRCYDLGCSLGATAQAVLAAVGDRPCEIVAVDESAAMLRRARQLAGTEPRIHWRQADIRDLAFEAADVVILNYTLQFLAPGDRLPLLERLHACLNDGGVLLLSEKLDGGGYFADLHLDFKRANGYSELEIAGKRSALENVMRIDTEAVHLARLRSAGFRTARRWFQCLNWASFIAWPTTPTGSARQPHAAEPS